MKNHAYNTIYDAIKKYDVNSLQSLIYSSTKEIVDAIDYWRKRRITLIKPKEENQIGIIDLEIMQLESILLAKTQFTIDYFQTDEVETVKENSDALMSTIKSYDSNFPNSTRKEDELPFKDKGTGEEKPKKILMSDFDIKIRDLIENTEKTQEEITAEAKNILLNNILVTDKKEISIFNEDKFDTFFDNNYEYLFKKLREEAKVIQLIPEKIKQSVLADHCKKLLSENKSDEAFEFAKQYLAKGDYIPTKENKKPTEWQDARIESWLKDLAKTLKVDKPKSEENSKDTKENKKEEKAEIPEDDTENMQEILVSLDYVDGLEKWLKSIKCTFEDVVDEEVAKVIKDKDHGGYKSISFLVPDINYALEGLKKFGVEATIVEKVEDEKNNHASFVNEEVSLTEEISHIDKMLKICLELRGDKENDPQNMDKIEAVVDNFYSSRTDDEYKDKKILIDNIKERPKLITDSKEFFNTMCETPKETYKVDDNEDMYTTVVSEIKTAYEKGEEKFEEEFIPSMVEKLNGKILCGKKDENIVNKAKFYTAYHVFWFIDTIVNSMKSEKESKNKVHPENELGKSAATASNPVASASKDQPVQEEKKKDPSDKLKEIIQRLVKNRGVLEDALGHPEIQKMKGETFNDPWEHGKLVLSEENYEKFITAKFDEEYEIYVSNLTSFPAADIIYSIKIARQNKVEAKQFSEEHLPLLKKKDGTYLSIQGNHEKAEIITKINGLEDFLKYVEDIYKIQDEIDKESEKYEESSVKTYKEFEQLLIQKSTSGTTLEDLKKWAKEEVLNKRFIEDPSFTSVPMFKQENEDAMNSYIEAFTRKHYETPEDKAEKLKKMEDYIKINIKNSERSLITFVNEVKDFCQTEKIDYKLGDLRSLTEKFAKELNEKMYNTYKETKKALEERGLTNKTFDKKSEETKEKELAVTATKNEKSTVGKEVIVSTDDSSNLEEIADKFKNVVDKENVVRILSEYTSKDEIAIIEALKVVVCDNKQVTDMQMTEAELNEWVIAYFTNKESDNIPEAKEIKSDEKDKTPALEGKLDYLYEKFENLATAKDKISFKTSLREIIAKYNDSSELRMAIIQTIKEGKGPHTVKVAKSTDVECHKIIKKAFENYNEKK